HLPPSRTSIAASIGSEATTPVVGTVSRGQGLSNTPIAFEQPSHSNTHHHRHSNSHRIRTATNAAIVSATPIGERSRETRRRGQYGSRDAETRRSLLALRLARVTPPSSTFGNRFA